MQNVEIVRRVINVQYTAKKYLKLVQTHFKNILQKIVAQVTETINPIEELFQYYF